MKRLMLAVILFVPTLSVAQTVTPGPPSPDFSLPGSYPTGRYFGPAVVAAPTAAGVSLANRLMAAPMYMRSASLVKTLSFDITTGNAAAWNARMCVYADTGAGLPGALVADGGTIAVGSGSVTGVQTATLAGNGVVMGPGWYWSAFMADNNSENVSSIGNGAAGPITSSRLMGWSSPANAVAGTTATGVFAAQTFGACPATFPAPTYADNVALPYVWLGF